MGTCVVVFWCRGRVVVVVAAGVVVVVAVVVVVVAVVEKVDGLRSLHKQSSTLKSAKHSAKSSLAQAS